MDIWLFILSLDLERNKKTRGYGHHFIEIKTYTYLRVYAVNPKPKTEGHSSANLSSFYGNQNSFKMEAPTPEGFADFRGKVFDLCKT